MKNLILICTFLAFSGLLLAGCGKSTEEKALDNMNRAVEKSLDHLDKSMDRLNRMSF